MPNQFLFSDWVSMEALRLLLNKLQVAQFFNHSWENDYNQEFPVGETITVKLPQRFTIRDGLQYTPQNINRISTTITANNVLGVDFQWDSVEKALKMERSRAEISKQYLEPAMAQIAQEIDSRAALFATQNTNNIVGQLGIDPTTPQIFNEARERLITLSCPPSDEKGMIIPPRFNTTLVPAMSALFNPASEISKQYKEGSIGKYAGADWYESMSLWRHTAGTWAGAVTVNLAGQSGSSLNINATNGDTFFAGDVFSIDNVNQVNPMTRRQLSTQVKQFVVTQDYTAAGSNDTIQISPAIYGPTTQYQNVDALPANLAALTLFPGTTSPNGKSGANALLLHPEAFAIVGIRLESPKATEVTSQAKDPETGIAVRLVRMFDPQTSTMVNRWDTCFGFGRLYSDNCAVRVLGA